MVAIYLHRNLWAKIVLQFTFGVWGDLLLLQELIYSQECSKNTLILGNSYAFHFLAGVLVEIAQQCWYIPEVWWVQMQPKDAPLSMMDKNREKPLHFAPRGAKFYCYHLNMPIATYGKQET